MHHRVIKPTAAVISTRTCHSHPAAVITQTSPHMHSPLINNAHACHSHPATAITRASTLMHSPPTHNAALGLGGASLGDLFVKIDSVQALQTVDDAHDRGVRYFDTAPWYVSRHLVCCNVVC
jgi:hypothetical protein